MELAKEAVMHIAGSIKVGMALVVASGAEKEFAPFACDALPGSGHEPHPFTATTSTILRSSMRIDLHADHPYGIGFFFRECVDFAFQLIGLFPVGPPRLAASWCSDLTQTFKHQHTARILCAHLGDRSRCFVGRIQILVTYMGPDLLITMLSLDRLARLPLFLGHPFEMVVAVLIEPLIRDKAGFNDPCMLTHRNDREILDVQINCHRDQVGVLLALNDLFGRDGFAL